MATKPINAIVRIAQLNENLPSTGKANKVFPHYELRTLGYDDDQFASAEELNYTFDNMGQWLTYYEEETDRIREQKIPDVELRIKDLEDVVKGLQIQIERERVSIGEVIEITGVSTNPATLKGYGTWVEFGQGQVTIGAGTFTDDRGESRTWTDGEHEGEYRHVQTEDELATHYHTFNSRISDDRTSVTFGQGGEGGADSIRTGGTDVGGKGRFINDTGKAHPMNNIQPSIVVYKWKRVA